MEKTCEICGTPLTGKQQRFCSKRCRNVFAGRISGSWLKPPDREWLANEYLLPPNGKGRSQLDISQELGVSKVTLRQWINKLGLHQDITERTIYFAKRPTYQMPTREWLFEHYITLNKTIREIASELGCSVVPVENWLNFYEIKKSGEQLAKNHSRHMSGKRNPAYTNGNSQRYIKRSLTKIKPKVCDWCKTKERIEVHHINHDRTDNSMDNLTWLCGNCNKLEAQLWQLRNKNRIQIIQEANRLIIEFTGE
jgi:transposase